MRIRRVQYQRINKELEIQKRIQNKESMTMRGGQEN